LQHGNDFLDLRLMIATLVLYPTGKYQSDESTKGTMPFYLAVYFFHIRARIAAIITPRETVELAESGKFA
jgi:hypothetical protein